MDPDDQPYGDDTDLAARVRTFETAFKMQFEAPEAFDIAKETDETLKLYGIDRKDRWCCPGHDKFPLETYRNRRSKKAHTRDTAIAHRRARARIRSQLHRLISTDRAGTDAAGR